MWRTDIKRLFVGVTMHLKRTLGPGSGTLGPLIVRMKYHIDLVKQTIHYFTVDVHLLKQWNSFLFDQRRKMFKNIDCIFVKFVLLFTVPDANASLFTWIGQQWKQENNRTKKKYKRKIICGSFCQWNGKVYEKENMTLRKARR